MGKYPALREEFLRRGWVENEVPEGKQQPHPAFHFLYTTKARHAFSIPLNEEL